MLPVELITFFGSSVLGGFMKIIWSTVEARRRERTYFLQALNAKARLLEDARKYDSPNVSITRRAIALLATFFVVCFPKLVAVYYPQIPVHIGYTEWSSGFLFFTEGAEKTHWQALQGLVITPLDTHLLSAVIGLYFGTAIAR